MRKVDDVTYVWEEADILYPEKGENLNFGVKF